MGNRYYFSHDYNARNDRKLIKLTMNHGMKGIGIYWCLVEMLFEEDGYMPMECERIAFELRTESDVIKSVINDFDLFCIDGEKFYSESVLRRLESRYEKSQKARESAEARWKSKGNDANAMRTHSEGNAIKERKGKEIKEDIPTFEIFKSYAIENEPNINLVNLKHKYEAWKVDDWHAGNPRKKIKNWKTTLLNTLQYIGTTENNTPPAYKILKDL